MPIYTIELDGKQYDLEGDHPPSEEEARSAIGSMQQPTQGDRKVIQQKNILGQIMDAIQSPGASVRSAIQGQGYLQGALEPQEVPTFGGMAEQATNQMGLGVLNSPIAKMLMPGGVDPNVLRAGGELVDMATDPIQLLTSMGIPGGAKPVAQGVEKAGQVVGQATKFEGALQRATTAKQGLDALRTTLGQAKKIALQEVADVPADLNWGLNKSQKIIEAIKNPIYEVEFTPEGGVVNTIGNLDKVKNAIGELISNEKIWEEAPKLEQRLAKQFYGKVNQSMKEAARGVGKPIDKVLDDYSTFMKNYGLINKTLTDSVGNIMANKLKSAFKFGAEPTIKEAWKAVAKSSPEIKSVMNSMDKRELLKNILKYSGYSAGGAVGIEVAKKAITGNF